MKKNIRYLLDGFLFTVSFFAVPLMVFASDGDASWEEWLENFYVDEIFGVIIGGASLIMLIKVAVIIGGELGKTFKMFAVAFLFVILSLVWRGVMEFYDNEELYAEIVFEILLYVGLLFVLGGAINAKRAILDK